MRKIGMAALIAACIGVFAVADAQAQTRAQAPAPAPAQHEDVSGGFYGRASLGLGAARTGFATKDDTLNDPDVTLGGFAITYDAALGFELPFGLAIHGSYRGWVSPSPKLKFDGNEIAIKDSTLALHNFGIGATFSPSVFFVSLMMGPAWLQYSFANEDVVGNTRKDGSWGFGSELGLGAMFMTTPAFSLGVGAFGSFHWIAETSDSDNGLLGYQASGRVIFEF